MTAVTLPIDAAADAGADPADPTASRFSACAPSSAEGTDGVLSDRRPGPVLAVADEEDRVLRLSDGGDDRSAWVTMLTTEHYALHGMRSASIGEANGRASVFPGAVPAGLIASASRAEAVAPLPPRGAFVLAATVRVAGDLDVAAVVRRGDPAGEPASV